MSTSTHERAPENAVWILYQLDAAMGNPLHEFVIEHALLVTALFLFGTSTQRYKRCAIAIEKETHSVGRECAQQAELALTPQFQRSVVLTYW